MADLSPNASSVIIISSSTVRANGGKKWKFTRPTDQSYLAPSSRFFNRTRHDVVIMIKLCFTAIKNITATRRPSVLAGPRLLFYHNLVYLSVFFLQDLSAEFYDRQSSPTTAIILLITFIFIFFNNNNNFYRTRPLTIVTNTWVDDTRVYILKKKKKTTSFNL